MKIHIDITTNNTREERAILTFISQMIQVDNELKNNVQIVHDSEDNLVIEAELPVDSILKLMLGE